VRLRITQFNISFKIEDETIDKFYLLFTVADTGNGITTEKQSKLFTLFGNTKNEDYTQSTSSGMGLAVARSIVANMKGCLWFFSKENRGSIFTFAIPLNFNDEEEGGTNSDFNDEITILATENLSNHIMSNIEKDFYELMSSMYGEDNIEEGSLKMAINQNPKESKWN